MLCLCRIFAGHLRHWNDKGVEIDYNDLTWWRFHRSMKAMCELVDGKGLVQLLGVLENGHPVPALHCVIRNSYDFKHYNYSNNR